jgi:hypothetical protein
MSSWKNKITDLNDFASKSIKQLIDPISLVIVRYRKFIMAIELATMAGIRLTAVVRRTFPVHRTFLIWPPVAAPIPPSMWISPPEIANDVTSVMLLGSDSPAQIAPADR